MSTPHLGIEELDVVALSRPIERWPAGTEGTVQIDHGRHKVVEIKGIEYSDDDMLEYLIDVATEDLRLVRKCPTSKPEIPVDQFPPPSSSG